LAAALVGCLLANFNACAAQLGAAAGCGQPQPQRPHRHVFTRKKQFLRARPLSRLQHVKSPYGAGCCAFPEQCLRSAGKRQIFPPPKICPFAKEHEYQLERAKMKMCFIFWGIYNTIS